MVEKVFLLTLISWYSQDGCVIFIPINTHCEIVDGVLEDGIKCQSSMTRNKIYWLIITTFT